ncbi:GerAB/ArcD/ProY family transporter [Paenibacillus sp. GCM10023252]|uniref:GerAB/ArcD/ProY family transporter n=1 Tax=Paenibacillus sp. GCM10023252 TaxID=3252649 RepID=UPI0036206F24
MNRYFYYNFLLVGLMNLMLYVPHVLIRNRYDGAVMSILIGGMVGTILAYMFMSALEKYPGRGMPEILALYYPRWVVTPIMFVLGSMWYFSALIVIVAYAFLINRFFNPDMSAIFILILLVVACAYGASRSTLSVVMMIEVGLLLNAPVILFILFKAIRDPHLSWDAMHTIANYVTEMPNLTSLSAATFVFTGYVNMTLFNRIMPPNFKFKHHWLIPVIGFTILMITFFVPIGIHGTEAVNSYLYVWSMTSDALIMQYGFIERVLFLFLIVYLNLSLVYTMSNWHHAMEYFKVCFSRDKPDTDPKTVPAINLYICGTFAVVSVLYMWLTTEKQDQTLTQIWLIVRMFMEVTVAIWLFVQSRRPRLRSYGN